MNILREEYTPILILLLFSIFLSVVLFLLSYIVAPQKPDAEKISAYECGFDPYEDARNSFDIRFYLVAILFIIFDLEVTFLFPWSLILNYIDFFGYFTMYIFLLILTIGFIYEWRNGALDWE